MRFVCIFAFCTLSKDTLLGIKCISEKRKVNEFWQNNSELDLPILCDHRIISIQFIQFSCSVMSSSLWSHESQHARPPCPSPTPRVYPNSCPLCWWFHLTISSSVVPFSFCLQSFPASGSFQMSQLFTSGGQNFVVSASTSVLPVNTQDWFPLGQTGWISLQWFLLLSLFIYYFLVIKYLTQDLSAQQNPKYIMQHC